MTTNAPKTVAQIACEYIGNEPDLGWTQADRLAVLAQAIETGVAEFFLDCVAEQIQLWAMKADGAFGDEECVPL